MSADVSIWLPLPILAYAAACLYFARLAFLENGNDARYFSAGHDLPPWMSALLLAGLGMSGWFLLAGTQEIARGGFSLASLLVGGIAVALPGVVLFKRIWLVARRLGLSSDAELLRRYYRSDFLALASTAVATLMAVGFAGLQLRAVGQLLSTLTDGAVSAPVSEAFLTVLLFAYVAIGGLRAIGSIGAIQTVLLGFGTAVFAGIVLITFDGFGGLNGALKALAADPADSSRFLVAGVIRFTAGLGRGDAGAVPTAMASFGLFVALMGLGANPLALKVVMSTRSPAGLAAGQTWVTAGVFGSLVAIGVAIIGASGLVTPSLSIIAILEALASSSPWFAGWLLVAIIAGVQLLAGLGLLVAAENLVRHLYKPLLHSTLTRSQTVGFTRIVAGLLALLSLLLQVLAPVALSALGGVALPLAVQLLVPLVGIAWIGRLTREGAVVGVGAGFAAVLLTEPLGYAVLSFLGLELPWGRWPWTLNSAVWGLAANLAAALLVSAATQRWPVGEERADARRVLAATGRTTQNSGLSASAWAAVLAWFFLAAGPGLLFGNVAFGAPAAADAFLLGMPSLWAWMVMLWALGLGLVWFLSYKIGLAMSAVVTVEPYRARPLARRDVRILEMQRRQRLTIAAAVIFGLVAFMAFSFGR
ncbi:sodium:solute symporter family transporter [Ancylobacter sp. VNQ12]|uniref:sodium:solute symporter family transporter n=1 Tax=Ancylobacter sp. VNQ12 TaxID=3400920 RepID=UPI003BFDA8F3